MNVRYRVALLKQLERLFVLPFLWILTMGIWIQAQQIESESAHVEMKMDKGLYGLSEDTEIEMIVTNIWQARNLCR